MINCFKKYNEKNSACNKLIKSPPDHAINYSSVTKYKTYDLIGHFLLWFFVAVVLCSFNTWAVKPTAFLVCTWWMHGMGPCLTSCDAHWENWRSRALVSSVKTVLRINRTDFVRYFFPRFLFYLYALRLSFRGNRTSTKPKKLSR